MDALIGNRLKRSVGKWILFYHIAKNPPVYLNWIFFFFFIYILAGCLHWHRLEEDTVARRWQTHPLQWNCRMNLWIILQKENKYIFVLYFFFRVFILFPIFVVSTFFSLSLSETKTKWKCKFTYKMKWGKLLWMRYIRANGILERFFVLLLLLWLSLSSLLISCCWLFILSHSVLSLCRLFYVLADLLSLVWRGWYYRLSLSAHSKVLFHVHRKSNLRVDFVIFMFTFTLFRYLKNKKKYS